MLDPDGALSLCLGGHLGRHFSGSSHYTETHKVKHKDGAEVYIIIKTTKPIPRHRLPRAILIIGLLNAGISNK